MGDVRPPVEPMLASTVTKLPAGDDLCYEPKWDGYRAIAFRGEGEVFLQSRSLRRLTTAFPDVARIVLSSVGAGTVLDGELLVWDSQLNRTSFSALQRRNRSGRKVMEHAIKFPAHYVVFDVLAVDDQDLRSRPLRERRAILEDILAAGPRQLPLSPQTDDPSEVDAWMASLPALGIEGVVIKDLSEPYRPGKRAWRKLKARTSIEAIIAGVTGSIHAPVEVLLGRLDMTDKLRYLGRTHPLTPAQRGELSPLLTRAGQDRRGGGIVHPWPEPLPAAWASESSYGRRERDLPYVQLRPTVVAEIQVDATQEDRLRWRHGVTFLRPRLDLSIYDVPLAIEDPDAAP